MLPNPFSSLLELFCSLCRPSGGLPQCLVLAVLIVSTFPEFVGSHVGSYPSQHHHENNIYIQSNISIQHNHFQNGKWTLESDDEVMHSPKWQWVLKPRRPQHHAPANITIRDRPVRHWWANLLRPHRPTSHSKRSALPPEATHNSTCHDGLTLSGPLCECLEKECPSLRTPEIMTLHGMEQWMTNVCSPDHLDQRVKELLKALWFCPQHMVCQVLSPAELKNLRGPWKTCRHEAYKLWTRFHKVFLVIRDFNDVFKHKFDLPDYSVMFNSTQCQESYNFWTCSIFLPLYLRHPESGDVSKVEPCQSVCKEVEKTCPFLIKGLEDDKAAGNPSFLCKDDLVPYVMKASVSPLPCCYKAVEDPLPGKWFSSVSGDQASCQNLDQLQLDHSGVDRWPSSFTSSLPDSGEGLGTIASRYANVQQRCNTIPSPIALVNITASEIGTSWYIWRQRLRESKELNQSLSEENDLDNDDDDDDDDDGFSFVKSFGQLLDWFSEFRHETSSNETLADSDGRSSACARTLAWPSPAAWVLPFLIVWSLAGMCQ